MHKNIMKSSHFWPLKRPKNVICKAIDLKFVRIAFQDVTTSMQYLFFILKIFRKYVENNFFIKYTVLDLKFQKSVIAVF